MNNINFLMIFDIVILGYGFWIMYGAVKMNKTKVPASMLIPEEDLIGSYNAGYDKGSEEAYATTENWFSNLQSVTIGEDGTTIHLIDDNGEEWVLVSDDYQN